MKPVLLLLLFWLGVVSLGTAQANYLVVHLKNGQTERIDIATIRSIVFENVNAIGEPGVIPGILLITGNRPNPFADRTNIGFELAEPSDVTVRIYDTGGRLVRQLECVNCPSGPNTLQWDGRGAGGAEAGAGLYFYTVTAGRAMQSDKMIKTEE
jgi:flagellar hook assembly protein FlgD